MKKLLLILLCLPMIGFGQVIIPDANFKAYLVGEPSINTNGDTEIQVSEATAFNGAINCSMMNITDLTGIEAFTALTSLWCLINSLTSLDVSNNTALILFGCSHNQLTSLDVSNNTALVHLDCSENFITSLDVSKNTALTLLSTHNNQITSLDVSQNTALDYLNCQLMQLTSLDVRNGNNQNISDFFCLHNANLTCINVDDANWSTTNWTVANSNIDTQQYFSNNCSRTSIEENTTNKELLKITDLLGRETKPKANTPFIEIYDDGTVEKRIVIE